MYQTMWLLKAFEKVFLLQNRLWEFIIRQAIHGLYLFHCPLHL